ncbi:ABC transporter permease [Desulfocurvus sp. DL9XJH121]
MMPAVLSRTLPTLTSLALLLGLWLAATALGGAALAPPPWKVLPALAALFATAQAWADVGTTLWRAMAGLGAALAAALVLGVPAGLNRSAARLTAPLVAALQSCPPVLWVSLAMVWCGTGSAVPVAVVFASVFPPLFANVTQGCLALDPRLPAMTRLFRVPRGRVLLRVLLPGVTPYVAAGLSYALSASWKVAAVAEYLASGRGVGARLYWAYHMLEMENLLAWGLVLVALGVGLEMTLVARLRRTAVRFTAKTRENA